jgi:hypothetical protein
MSFPSVNVCPEGLSGGLCEGRIDGLYALIDGWRKESATTDTELKTGDPTGQRPEFTSKIRTVLRLPWVFDLP